MSNFNAHVKREMRVQVFRNLHQPGVVWSIQVEVESGRWLTLAHHETIIVKDVKFVVQPAGHAKVNRIKAKNVHAFVRGTLVVDSDESRRLLARFARKVPIQVSYNPYKVDRFVDKNGLKTLDCASVVLLTNGMDRPQVEALDVTYVDHDARAFLR